MSDNSDIIVLNMRLESFRRTIEEYRVAVEALSASSLEALREEYKQLEGEIESLKVKHWQFEDKIAILEPITAEWYSRWKVVEANFNGEQRQQVRDRFQGLRYKKIILKKELKKVQRALKAGAVNLPEGVRVVKDGEQG